MGVLSWLGIDPAALRRLKAYGKRSGVIINGTGTGTSMILSPAKRGSFPSYDNWKSTHELVGLVANGDSSFQILAFSGETDPIRVSSSSQMGYKRALSGKVYGFNKYDGYEVALGIIGNSLDDYRLTILANKNRSSSFVPLFNLQVHSASAPGYNDVIFEDGVIEEYNAGLNIGTNSKIRDKVFVFNFARATIPSSSAQKYDSLATTNFFEDMLGM